MFRLFAAMLAIVAPAALAASAPVQPSAVRLDIQLRDASREAAIAQAEQRRLESLAAEASDAAVRLRAEQLAAAQAILAAEAGISAADAQARLVQAQLVEQRRKLAAAQAPVRSLLGGLYLTARRPPLLFLANGESSEDLVKLRLLIDAAAPVIDAKADALRSELQRIAALEERALAARQAMASTRDELAQRRERFAELEARAIRLAEERRSQALGAGDVALARQEQMTGLERDMLSGRAAASLARDLAALGPAPLPRAVPLSGPEIAYRLPAPAGVTEGLGSVSANGIRSRGVTLATRRGAPLVAPASGTILFAGPFRDYDGVIIIDHGRGWKSVLVNAGSGLAKGSKVRMGQDLGIALGPVEVQLLRDGQAVSPAIIAGSSPMLSNGRKSG
jgi:septal ring factor EnvC (AmiA/AmiB activator)